MGLKVFTIQFEDLSKDYFLRLDFDYFEIKKELNLDKAPKLKKYLTFLETGKPIKPEDYEPESNNIHIVVRNIVDGKFEENSLIFINDDKAEELKKYRIQKGDIVIAISSNCGSSFYFDGKDKRNLTLSHYLARFRINQNLINPIFLNYYINSKLLRQYFRSVETGKTLKNLSKYYIKEMPVLIPEKPKQDKIVSQIEPIEKKIKELKSKIKDPQEIINKVFAREFGFNLEKFEELKKEKFFEVDFNDFAFDDDLKFNVSSISFIKNNFVIPNVKYTTIKNISKEIFAGGDKPKEIVEEKDNFYNIPVYSNGKENNGLQGFSNKVRVKEKSVTISARGTIGYAVFRDEKYFPIVRLITIIFDENKILGKYLEHAINFLNLEKSENTIAQLTVPMAKKIKIPLPNLNIQQKIVDEIKVELDKQEEIKKKIEEERNKIDEIIEKAIK